MAAGLTEPTDGLGAVGGYKDLARYTTLGGSLFVFALPGDGVATTMQRPSDSDDGKVINAGRSR
jgi:hypothetical protein